MALQILGQLAGQLFTLVSEYNYMYKIPFLKTVFILVSSSILLLGRLQEEVTKAIEKGKHKISVYLQKLNISHDDESIECNALEQDCALLDTKTAYEEYRTTMSTFKVLIVLP